MAVTAAEPLVDSLVPASSDHGRGLQLDQFLPSVAGPLRNQPPALLPSSGKASLVTAPWALGTVRLVEVVLEPGKWACLPFATSAASTIA
jgi:hypothetical protein